MSYSPDIEQLPNAVVVDDPLRRSIEYFCMQGLPILRNCQPSPLWDYLVAQLLDPAPSIRRIAAALGAQQRMIDHQNTIDAQPGSGDAASQISLQSSRHYASAIQCLRRSIDILDEAGERRLPLICLLMVILESLRGSPSHLLIHLKSGIKFLREREDNWKLETREVARILGSYAIDSTMFNPLSPSALAVQLMIAERPETEGTDDPLVDVLILASDLLRAMTVAMDFSALGSTIGASHTRSPPSLDQLGARQRKIEQAIKVRMAALDSCDPCRYAMHGFAQARCLLVRVYIDCAWAARQTEYDTALETFVRIVDLIEESLKRMRPTAYGRGSRESPAAFSVGIRAQQLLLMVVHQCRDYFTRHRAYDLLNKCPRHEGPLEIGLTKSICEAIMDFEESFTGAPDKYIPEHCRVHHYSLVESIRMPGTWEAVKLYIQATEGAGMVSHDVQLKCG